jgi:hypothetical protein
MTIDPFRIPTDAEIVEAERKLNFKFPDTYVEFLKGGSNVANAVFEPAVILPGCSYLDIFDIAETAWGKMGVPKEWLPFIEDNSDYFLISQTSEVSHRCYLEPGLGSRTSAVLIHLQIVFEGRFVTQRNHQVVHVHFGDARPVTRHFKPGNFT